MFWDYMLLKLEMRNTTIANKIEIKLDCKEVYVTT